MKTIDHRILIPSTPERVWDILSDISRIPDWQVDCREIVFLTSKRAGAGLRWRQQDDKRREFVYEVSAWYEGLGYEYYFVDGANFRDARARLRLQEIPEGTVVQWTFSYEPGGFLGGMRDSLGLYNAIDRAMTDGLRRLYQLLKSDAAALAEHQAKSLMRDAPDVEARSAYQPRHPNSKTQGATKPSMPLSPNEEMASRSTPTQRSLPLTESPWSNPRLDIQEPEFAPDDTRPNPAATSVSTETKISDSYATDDIDLLQEPEFLTALEDLSRFEPPPTAEETQPGRTRIEDITFQAPAPQLNLYEPPLLNSSLEIESVPVAEEHKGIIPTIEAMPPTSNEGETRATTPDIDATPRGAPIADFQAVPKPRGQDTRSIWEIFNVPRPDETLIETPSTDEIPAADTVKPISELASALETPLQRIVLDQGTRGLRQTIRRKIVRIRRPY